MLVRNRRIDATSRGSESVVLNRGGQTGGRRVTVSGQSIMSFTLVEKLTDEQIAEIREAFQLFDKDGSGSISTKELGMAMRSLGQNPTEDQLMDMVNEVDENDSGAVDFPEFLKMMARMVTNTDTEVETREAFRCFDVDNNGYIKVDEMRYVMRNLGVDMSEREINELIAEADTNKDGRITYESFAVLMCPNRT
ncbi:Calmodulin [Lamellibrachia satsuma]|nr:Calmodulin [Lamellibrachia satsuma]